MGTGEAGTLDLKVKMLERVEAFNPTERLSNFQKKTRALQEQSLKKGLTLTLPSFILHSSDIKASESIQHTPMLSMEEATSWVSLNQSLLYRVVISIPLAAPTTLPDMFLIHLLNLVVMIGTGFSTRQVREETPLSTSTWVVT